MKREIENTIKSIREALSGVAAFEAKVAKLRAEKDQLEQDTTLEPAILRRYAEVSAGVQLASAAFLQQHKRVVALAESANEAIRQAANHITTTHSNIDGGITSSVLRSASEDVRESIDVKTTRPYKSEQSSRWVPHLQNIYVWERSTLAEVINALQVLAKDAELLASEYDRASSVAKKLGVAA